MCELNFSACNCQDIACLESSAVTSRSHTALSNPCIIAEFCLNQTTAGRYLQVLSLASISGVKKCAEAVSMTTDASIEEGVCWWHS